jgi:hypothetical protein
MTREEKVKAIKLKIRKEIEEIKSDKSILYELSKCERNTILFMSFVYALEDSCNNSNLFNDWYSVINGVTTYTISHETLDMLLLDETKILRQFKYAIIGLSDDYSEFFYSKEYLNDKWIEFELFTVIEKLIFEKKQKEEKENGIL